MIISSQSVILALLDSRRLPYNIYVCPLKPQFDDFQDCQNRNPIAEGSREDDSSDDEEIKDLMKNISISGKKDIIKQKLGSASPISSNASEDEAACLRKK